MSKRKKQEGKKGLDEWMATYSDMVTLLMCFFVLLYASSTPDETKWQYIYQAFSSKGEYVNPFVTEQQDYEEGGGETDEGDGNSNVPLNLDDTGEKGDMTSTGHMPQTFDQLFNWVSAAAAGSEFSSFMSVEQASSRIYIRFDSSIMFEGDSAVLLDTGKKALKLLFPGIRAVSDYIQRIIVSGHTSAGISVVNDWDLSAARACSVTKYMDFSVLIDSERYKVEGCAQYDPIATNDTDEGRAKNRRVELILVRNNIAAEDTEIIQDILKYDYNMNQTVTDPEDRFGDNGGFPVSEQVQQILDTLDERYSDNTGVEESASDDFTGPVISEPLTEIPEDMLTETVEGEDAAAESSEAADTATETEAAAAETAAE